jgi:hypothetical protein
MKTSTNIMDSVCETVAWTLYGLSKVHLAPKPRYTTCIGEFITCGYCMDRMGFPKFPLHKLADEFEKDMYIQKRIHNLERVLGNLLDALDNCPGTFSYSASIEDEAREVLGEKENH